MTEDKRREDEEKEDDKRKYQDESSGNSSIWNSWNFFSFVCFHDWTILIEFEQLLRKSHTVNYRIQVAFCEAVGHTWLASSSWLLEIEKLQLPRVVPFVYSFKYSLLPSYPPRRHYRPFFCPESIIIFSLTWSYGSSCQYIRAGTLPNFQRILA